jgi:hypothetical protein
LDVNFRTDFTLGERNPEHLAYFIFASIDFNAMSTEYGIEFDDDTLTKQNGRISSEIIIDNYKTVGMMTQFYTESGVLWEGSVHKMPSEERDIWMTGPGHSQGSEYLTIQKVPNNKIQDFRHVEDIKRYSAEDLEVLGTKASTLHEVQKLAQNKLRSLKSDNMEPKRKEAYFSDIYLTKDMYNDAKFAFAVDYKKLLMDTSAFKKLYEITSEETEKLINYSRIRSLSVKRRRVIEQKTKNKLGSEMTGEVLFDRDLPVETILTSSDDHFTGDFKEVDQAGTGGLKEESFSVITGAGTGPSQYGIRHFNAFDKTISGITNGLYQYGVEITVEERAAEYLKVKLDELISARKTIHTYYLDATKLGMTKYLSEVANPHIDSDLERSIDITKSIGNYNPVSNRLTEEFINTHSDNNDKFVQWLDPFWKISILLGVPLTQLALVQQVKWLEPATATPKSIMAVIGLLDDFISKLNNLIGLDSDSKTLLSSTTRIEYWFKNNEHDASEPKGVGYAYLTDKVQDRMMRIPAFKYAQRVELERSLYFKVIPKDGPALRPEYLSPIRCYFGRESYGVTESPWRWPDTYTAMSWKGSHPLSSRIMNYNINRKIDLPPGDANDRFTSLMSSAYAHLGLTIDSNLPKMYRALMAAFVKGSVNNEDNNKSPFAEIPASVLSPTNPKEAGIKTWKDGYGNNIRWNVHNPPISTKVEILLSCGFSYEDIIEFAQRVQNAIGRFVEARTGELSVDDHNTIDSFRNAIKTSLPPQLQALLPELAPNAVWDVHSEDEDPTKGVKASTFQFRYNRINAIEYLVGYEDASGDSRIKNPIWELLTADKLSTIDYYTSVLCRMRKFECQAIGIEHSKSLKLPVYDNYFILHGRGE